MIGKHNYWILMVWLLICFSNNTQAQQAALETFGQNRIQTKKQEWQYYDSTHFRVFYSSYGKFNAQFVLQQAEADITSIVYMMGARQPRKINIVLYNSYTDFKQSNIGRYNEELALGNGGSFDVGNNSLSIYFDGTHNNLRQQVRKGIVTLIKDNLLYGYTFKEVIKNSLKLNIPNWFTSGYINYVSDDWKPEQQAKLKSILGKRPKRKFNDFIIDHPQLIGHSLFNFIAKKYDDGKVNDVLFIVRVRNNVDKAIESVFKKRTDVFYKEWRSFYYSNADSVADKIDTDTNRNLFAKIKPHKGATLKNFSISPNGADVAYCEIKDGSYAVLVYNTSSKKSVRIVSNEIKTNLEIFDPNYPILCWNKDGKKLAVMYEKDFLQRLKVYDAKNGRISDRILTLNKFDRLNSMCFMEDDDKLVISAIKKGQSDLYQYVIKNAQMINITKDVWNDINPTFISRNGQEGVLFMSNRPENRTTVLIENNELPLLPFHIYFYNTKTASSNLLKISDGIDVPIENPIMYGRNDFAFLITDDKNTKQRVIASVAKDKRDRDSIYFYKTIELQQGILQQAYIAKTNTVMEIVQKLGQYEIYNTPVKTLLKADSIAMPLTFNALKPLQLPKTIDKYSPHTFYLTEFENDIDSLKIQSKSALKAQPRKYKTKQYLSTFSPDFFQTTADNSVLFNRYQNISQQGLGYQTPDLAGLLKLSLIDVMEDHKITAAVRIPTSFGSGSAYMLKYANYKKRLDWGISFFRNAGNYVAEANAPPPFTSPFREYLKITNNYVEANVVWPFNITTSLKASSGLRIDRSIYKLSTEFSSKLPNQNSVWNFNRLEYVYDNTAQSMYNIRKGTKFKIYQEAFFQYKDSNYTLVSGLDFRHYLPLFKNCILASRLSNAYSYGSAKILYSLGGIDNEINLPNFSNNRDSLNIDATINYQYQTIATTLRGYRQNTALGSSYGILNEEIRIPLANSIFNRTFRSKFLNEFQFVLFADIASAWAGFSPGGTYTIFSSPPRQQQYSTYFGYGVGARTKLFGYNMHADVAWNNEPLPPGVSKQPRLHISTIQDF
jgi:hypothetical protein